MSQLFTPFRLRDLTIPNRVFVSPMCMYSSEDGMPTDFHLVHLGARALGGAGLVIQEATAVVPEGRITLGDAGIWSDDHAAAYRRITKFVADHGAVPGIQLAHAGRKASTDVPWRGGKPLAPGQGDWQTLSASALPFGDGWHTPRAMTTAEIDGVVDAFAAAARRAAGVGFKVAEVHAAHGYLLHQFLSPASNHRTDDYGGSFDNRVRLVLRVTESVRAAWPRELPVFVRLSCTDWLDAPAGPGGEPGAWDLPQSVELARRLKGVGADLIDCSSGGNTPHAKIPVGPGYQVPLAATIRREAGIPTAAVGMIVDPAQAEQTVSSGQADAVLLARALLRDPNWPLHAAAALRAEVRWPPQYERTKA